MDTLIATMYQDISPGAPYQPVWDGTCILEGPRGYYMRAEKNACGKTNVTSDWVRNAIRAIVTGERKGIIHTETSLVQEVRWDSAPPTRDQLRAFTKCVVRAMNWSGVIVFEEGLNAALDALGNFDTLRALFAGERKPSDQDITAAILAVLDNMEVQRGIAVTHHRKAADVFSALNGCVALRALFAQDSAANGTTRGWDLVLHTVVRMNREKRDDQAVNLGSYDLRDLRAYLQEVEDDHASRAGVDWPVVLDLLIARGNLVEARQVLSACALYLREDDRARYNEALQRQPDTQE